MLSTRSLELLDYISFAILSLLQPYVRCLKNEIQCAFQLGFESWIHRHSEEWAERVPWATPIMGQIRSKIGEKDGNGPYWGVVFHENTSSKFKLDQKEQNSFGNPQFYSSIVPMLEFTSFGDWMDQINVRSTKGHNFPVFRLLLSLMAAKWNIHISLLGFIQAHWFPTRLHI